MQYLVRSFTTSPLLWQIYAWPLLAFSCLFSLSYGLKLDFVWCQWLFQWEGQQWLLQDSWLMETVLHRGVRSVHQLLVLTLLLYWAQQQWRGSYRRSAPSLRQQKQLGLLLLSILTSSVLIAVLKKFTHMACPWDLQQFGGSLPFYGLFQSLPAGSPLQQCFPAGHASIGFSWIGLYFFIPAAQSRQRRITLFVVLAIGFGLGLVQQLRGAHFISHDITSAFLCWLVAAGIFQHFNRQEHQLVHA